MTKLESSPSALILDGAGSATPISWDAINDTTLSDGVLWLHMDYKEADTLQRISESGGLGPVALEALLAEDTRPRSLLIDDGLLIILRGINRNHGEDADDMVSLRIWTDAQRIISVRHRFVAEAEDIRRDLAKGSGPKNSSEFLSQIIYYLSSRMEETVSEISDSLDALEEDTFTENAHTLRSDISAIRRKVIRLRRYLAPQRDVLLKLPAVSASWLQELDRGFLRESGDRMTRYVEDLESAKDRSAIVQDELDSRVAARTSQTMYVLSIITTIFLPLSLLAGMLGMNVGGIPGQTSPHAFEFVCAFLVVLAGLQLYLFRRMRWV